MRYLPVCRIKSWKKGCLLIVAKFYPRDESHVLQSKNGSVIHRSTYLISRFSVQVPLTSVQVPQFRYLSVVTSNQVPLFRYLNLGTSVKVPQFRCVCPGTSIQVPLFRYFNGSDIRSPHRVGKLHFRTQLCNELRTYKAKLSSRNKFFVIHVMMHHTTIASKERNFVLVF